MEKQRKYKFKNSVWIIGNYKQEEVLGRAFSISGKNYIMILTEDARPSIVAFDAVSQLRKLILQKKLPAITTSIEHIKKKTFLDVHILETLKLINKQ